MKILSPQLAAPGYPRMNEALLDATSDTALKQRHDRNEMTTNDNTAAMKKNGKITGRDSDRRMLKKKMLTSLTA